MSFDLSAIPALITAVGALGFASMGIVETLGKSLLVYDTPGARRRQLMGGLPYAGYGSVKRLIRRLGPALEVTYGDRYAVIIAEQYRNGRAAGQAPETIRQGVRLGLPYLSRTQAAKVIGQVWGLNNTLTNQLADALTSEKGPAEVPEPPEPAAAAAPAAPAPAAPPAVPPVDPNKALALAARFATALDTSVEAAFLSSEAQYQSWIRFWAGFAAVGLSVGYFAATKSVGTSWFDLTYWFKPVLVGLVAVPLAPIAKDLSTGVSQALTALGQIRNKPAK
jgi:hypothetical protein